MIPTPTPFPDITPTGFPDIDLGAFNLWNVTDEAIHTWNLIGAGRIALQLIILVTLVLIGVWQMMRFAQLLTRRDAEE